MSSKTATSRKITKLEIPTAVERYRELRPDLEPFELSLAGLVRSLLVGEGIKVQHIESRCKDISSFEEKISRKRYRQPFDQMTDIVGLRVILYYRDHVDLTVQVLRREFRIDESNSADKREPKQHDVFGYRSYHLVLELDHRRAVLPEWRPFAGRKAEVQVRTILEHAWAAIDNDLFYQRKKRGIEPDPHARRKFNALMAQIETMDDTFFTVRGMLDEASVMRAAGVSPFGESRGDESEADRQPPEGPIGIG